MPYSSRNRRKIWVFLSVLPPGRQGSASFSPDTTLGSSQEGWQFMNSLIGPVTGFRKLIAITAASGLLVASALATSDEPAGAVGASSNSITASSAPSAGSARGSY